jgi:hypothetical protein
LRKAEDRIHLFAGHRRLVIPAIGSVIFVEQLANPHQILLPQVIAVKQRRDDQQRNA